MQKPATLDAFFEGYASRKAEAEKEFWEWLRIEWDTPEGSEYEVNKSNVEAIAMKKAWLAAKGFF